MARSVEIARAFITLEAETKGLDQQLAQAEKSLGRTANFIKAHPYAAATALGVAAITAGIHLARMAEETNRAIGVIATRVPEASGKIDQLRGVVNRLAIDYGIAQDQVIETMDAASRAGVSNAKELEQVAEAAIRMGKVLGQNGAALIEGLDAALDIFGIAAKDATAVMIQFFAAAEGRTSVDDLLDSVTKLAPAIAGTGLDLVTTTNALAALIDEGFEPGKKLIAEFAERLKNEGVPAIQALADKVAGTGGAVEAMAKYSAALAKNTTDIESNIQRGQSELKASLLELGTALQPVIAKLTLAGAALIRFLNPASHGVGALLKDAREKADAAAKSTDNAAASVDRLGKTGGIASGEIGKLTATLIEAKGATDELGSKSVADLKRYESALKEANKQGKLDEAGKKSLIAVIKELDERRKTAVTVAKKSADTMDELQRLANNTALDLLGAHQKEWEELERTFREKMEGMNKADHATAEALLKKAHNNQLLAWAGFDSKLEESAGKRSLTYTKPVIDAGVAVTDFNEVLKKHGKVLTEDEAKTIASALAWTNFKDAAAGVAFTVSDAANGMLEFIDSLGMADEKTVKLVRGIADLAAGIGQIASGNIAGGLIQGISGLSGAIAGLFGGESASARAVRIELEQTQEALERHRQTLGDLIDISTPGAKTENLVGGVQNILAAFAEMQAQGGVAAVLSGVDAKTVGKELAKLGLTIADLEDLAKQLGIDLHPGGTKLFNTAQLNAILSDLGARDSGFENTFEGQRERNRVRQQIAGADPTQVLLDFVELVTGALGSPALAAALKDADLNTAGGRGSVIGQLLALFDSGDLTGADLGGLNLKQFREVIQDLADMIRNLGDVTEPINLPVGTGKPPIPDVGAVVDGWTEAIEASAFPPSLEASYWDKAFELDTLQLKALDGILASIDRFAPIQPPPLPPGVLGGSTGRGGTTVQVTGPITVQVVGTGDPEADGRAAGRAFVDQIAMMDEQLGRRAQAQQRFMGSVVVT